MYQLGHFQTLQNHMPGVCQPHRLGACVTLYANKGICTVACVTCVLNTCNCHVAGTGAIHVFTMCVQPQNIWKVLYCNGKYIHCLCSDNIQTSYIGKMVSNAYFVTCDCKILKKSIIKMYCLMYMPDLSSYSLNKMLPQVRTSCV